MRVLKANSGVSVLGISGTHVVLLAFDVTNARRKGLLGFAIHRRDHTEDEQYWLRGFKTFEATDPNPNPGSLVSTQEHPVQSFVWGDYTAKPEHRYTYTVVPTYGTPRNLKEGPRVAIEVKTQSERMGRQSVIFNRGVAGSQAYARKFGNVSPDKIKNKKQQKAAYTWLSRGLEEAILDFIGQAKGKDYSLRASVYEFDHAPVLNAFKKAHASGSDVKIVYDRRKRGPFKSTEKAARKAGLLKLEARSGGNVMIPRETNSAISHNKFIVLLKKGRPVQVWTGSTNFTAGGIFGQSNVGHIIRNAKLAKAYVEYWGRLAEDPEFKEIRPANVAATPDPKGAPASNSITPIFSPRTTLDALEWYAQRMDAARQTLGFTAAFGISSTIAPVLLKKKPYLRYLMVENQGRGDKQKADFKKISKIKNNRIAMGSVLSGGAGEEAVGGDLHRWLKEELTDLNVHVRYLHTKYLLVDPLTDQPIVISGSANFSAASTKNNDENMVVLRGHTDVADAFFGEFMRLFNHLYFRTVVRRQTAMETPYLDPDDSWTRPYFKRGTDKYGERRLYASAMKAKAKPKRRRRR